MLAFKTSIEATSMSLACSVIQTDRILIPDSEPRLYTVQNANTDIAQISQILKNVDANLLAQINVTNYCLQFIRDSKVNHEKDFKSK